MYKRQASERATGRPLQWCTIQYLSSPAPGAVLELEVDIAASGRQTSQTQVTGSIDGVRVMTALCAHNTRPAGDAQAFATMPDVPAPEDSASFAELFVTDAPVSFFDSIDRRVARGRLGFDTVGEPNPEGFAIWTRLVDDQIGSPATQGFVADMGPLGVCAALGIDPGGSSLDNTVRIVDPRPSEWVLIDMVADGMARSVGHVTAHLWSQDGRLLGIAQQTAIIRTTHHRAPPK